MQSRIGVFSGTFDPVHLGHVAFARRAMEVCGLNEVVFLPERNPRGKQNVTDVRHRIALLEHTVASTRGLRVVGLRSERFTVGGTLPELRHIFGDAQLTLLVGSDVVRTFLYRWEGIERLFKEVALAVGMRTGDGAAELSLIMARLEREQGVRINHTFIPAPKADLASSKIRGGRIDTSHLHPAAREYIQRHGLYL